MSLAQTVFTHRVLLVGLAVLVFSAPAGAAATCRATTSGTSSGSGTWASPMDLQSALSNTACSEVWVTAGIYTPTPGTDRAISFHIRPSVAVYGGFAGSENQRTERNPAIHVTTLSGDIGTPNIISDNSYRVVYMNGTTSAGIIDNSTVLDGFTISGANNTITTSPASQGGGLYCDGSGSGHACSPTLSNVTFSGNRANNGAGGAMYNDGTGSGTSSPSLRNVTFSGNHAKYCGGAMFNGGYASGSSAPALSDVTFNGNSSASNGGALCNSGNSGGTSSPTLSNVTFNGNSAMADGGAIYSVGDSNGTSIPTLRNVIFSSNSATRGGAMFNNGAGGASSPTLSNVTFSGNSATIVGGAMYNYGYQGISNPVLSNVTFSGNSAKFGGAMVNAGSSGISSPWLSNVTFSDNSATADGGAMHNDGTYYGASSPILSNVIAWGNSATNNGPEIYNNSAIPTIDHSVIQGSGGSGGGWDTGLGNDGGGNIDADSKLGVLADNGGITQTMLPGAGSSAIDTGSAATCANGDVNKLDQRGVSRPQGSGCDIGAVEVQGDVIFVDGFDSQSP